MGTTPTFGIQYPDGSVVPSRETWIEEPLLDVDAKIAAWLRARFRRGESGGTIAAGDTYVDVPVSFSPAFGTVPTVDVTLRAVTTAPYQAIMPARQSATGFTVRLMRPAGAATTAVANLSFNWFATDLPDA